MLYLLLNCQLDQIAFLEDLSIQNHELSVQDGEFPLGEWLPRQMGTIHGVYEHERRQVFLSRVLREQPDNYADSKRRSIARLFFLRFAEIPYRLPNKYSLGKRNKKSFRFFAAFGVEPSSGL